MKKGSLTNNQGRCSVFAPVHPGHEPTMVATTETLAEARQYAARYSQRRDLRYCDVFIRLGNGRIVERCGPAR